MTDLHDIKMPYGLLKEYHPEVAKALRKCGGPWERYQIGIWLKTDCPQWDDDTVYRLAATKPSIDWSHVSDEFIALATGSGGFTHLFDRRPDKGAQGWLGGYCTSVVALASFRPGTCRWEDSLVMRPGYEEQAND